MDSVNSQRISHTPQVGFIVHHYWNHISTPNGPPMARCVGVFTSLEHAQHATRCELQYALDTYAAQGYHGRYFSAVSLSLPGLITAYVHVSGDAGQAIRHELLLSRFCIDTVDVWHPSWSAKVHLASPDSLIRVSDGHPKSRLAVSTPDPSNHKLSPDTTRLHVRHQEELSPEWARSRIPLFARRDEGPFRGPGEPPYAERMQFSPPKPVSAVHSGPEQPEDWKPKV